MKIENNIGWCDETTNAVTGCDKVSPGCKNCYAATGTRARVLRADGIETWGAGGSRMPVAGMPAKLRRLNKLCICDRCHTVAPIEYLGKNCGCYYIGNGVYPKLRRIRLFADSNSDWLDGKWQMGTLTNFLYEIFKSKNVDTLLLTKRPENAVSHLEKALKFAFANASLFMDVPGFMDWLGAWIQDKPPANVWLGVSVESQKYADERIPVLLKIPAVVRFLSCEPLLGEVRLPFIEYCERCARSGFENGTAKSCPHCCGSGIARAENRIDWVIVGGESGKDRRDCGVEAICGVAQQCVEAGVPVYVKQDVGFHSGEQGRIPAEVLGLKQFPVGGGHRPSATQQS